MRLLDTMLSKRQVKGVLMLDVLYIDGQCGRQNDVHRALVATGLSVQTVATFTEAALLVGSGAHRLLLMYLDNLNSHEGVPFCSLVHPRDPLRTLIVLMEEPSSWLEEQLFHSGVSDVITGVQTHPELIAKHVKVRLLASRLLSIRGGTVALGDTLINFDRCEVRRNGVVYPVSGVVLDLLWYFICNAGRVISRQELCESPIWARSVCTPPAEGGKTFDIHVSRLRRLVEGDPRKPRLIQSVRGIGWKLGVEPVWHTRSSPAVALSGISGAGGL